MSSTKVPIFFERSAAGGESRSNKEATMKTLKGVIIGTIVFLTALSYLAPPAMALSPEKGDFVILGREDNGQLIDEKINLKASAGVCDVILSSVKSGTAVLILDVKIVAAKKFYIVSTIGKDGGMMGWTDEDYIHEILPSPPQE